MPLFLFLISKLVEIKRNLEIISGILQTGLIEFLITALFCFGLFFHPKICLSLFLSWFHVFLVLSLYCKVFICCIYLSKFASYSVDHHLSLIS